AAGCLSCALLVVNNLRDIPTDTIAGKRTLAVRLGDQPTRWLFVALLVAAFGLAVVAAIAWRPEVALSLVAAVAAGAPIRTVLRGALGPTLIPALAGTGRLQLVYGALATIGLVLATR